MPNITKTRKSSKEQTRHIVLLHEHAITRYVLPCIVAVFNAH